MTGTFQSDTGGTSIPLLSLPRLETVVQVPIMEGVPHLIENDSRIAYHGVDVGMRMSIDPNIYPAVSDELTQLGREG